MKTLISFFSSNLSEIIAILWLLNIVFFIYAIFDTSKSGNNDLIIISLFWCMLNFYATGIYIACDISKEHSSTVSTHSSSSFARPAFLIISLARLKGAALWQNLLYFGHYFKPAFAHSSGFSVYGEVWHT